MPDGSVGYLLVGCGEVFKEIVPYTDLTAELVGTIAIAPTFSPVDVDGWVCEREPWFTIGTPVLYSDDLPGDEGWEGGRFGLALYFSYQKDSPYPFHVAHAYKTGGTTDGSGIVVDFAVESCRYVKEVAKADLTPEQREICEALKISAYGPSASPSEE